jgi:glutathione synthase/RimK-type ligase-like ATP-grasp enzyme
VTQSVVIVAPSDDEHAIAVRDRLTAKGAAASILDFGEKLSISLGSHPRTITVGGKRVTPAAVYVRSHELAELPLAILHRWERLGTPIWNPLSALAQLSEPYQLALLAAGGIPVPDSLWTNDPAAVRAFGAGRSIVTKPVSGGTTSPVHDLELLRRAPACFQEQLPGHDVRVYVLDGTVVSVIEIQPGDELRVRGLTPDLRDVCVRAASVLGLRFAAIELKANAAGQLKVLRLDPSPPFLDFDTRAGTKIGDALLARLSSASIAL